MTIATKQPAMTAATLAASLDGRDDRDTRLDALVELAAEVSRTQWLSIAGNVTVTLLTAFAIAMTAVQFVGWNPADAGEERPPAARPAPVEEPCAVPRGDRRRLPVPERADLRLLRQPVAVSPHPAAAAPREMAAQAARRRAAGAALDLRRAQPRRTGGQLPVRLHARLHADRGPAGRPAARHSPRRVRIGEPGLWARRRAVRGAGRNHTGERGRRIAGRARQPASSVSRLRSKWRCARAALRASRPRACRPACCSGSCSGRGTSSGRRRASRPATATQVAGMYQIGDVNARSCSVIGTLAGIVDLKRTVS